MPNKFIHSWGKSWKPLQCIFHKQFILASDPGLVLFAISVDPTLPPLLCGCSPTHTYGSPQHSTGWSAPEQRSIIFFFSKCIILPPYHPLNMAQSLLFTVNLCYHQDIKMLQRQGRDQFIRSCSWNQLMPPRRRLLTAAGIVNIMTLFINSV